MALPEPALDPELFPAAFLRLLGAVPAAVRRGRAGLPGGRAAWAGEGGRFLFRGHRAYRPGDDPRRLDWKVAARLGRLAVREFDAEHEPRAEVWLDGSASMGPCGGRVAAWRAAALAVAVELAAGARVRLGVVRAGVLEPPVEVDRPARLGALLGHLARTPCAGRAGWALALPRLARRLPRGARLVLVSDLLSQAGPEGLRALGGRGVRGLLLHLRVPEVHAPAPGASVRVRDAEGGGERLLRLDRAAAARVAGRARAHAALWARHAQAVGLACVPFAPGQDEEALLRRLCREAR
ncbi:MAG: DUF58 domain-containing protein [Planctomycetia bacterium]